MSRPYFQFKQFTVWHDRSAMRVGTDGVLLGSWASVDGLGEGAQYAIADRLDASAGLSVSSASLCPRLLDVGTGTGLIALMLAQRLACARVVGVEVDDASAFQAEENVRRSPFSGRVEVVHTDFRDYTDALHFDLIVCNPPFFTETLQCPDPGRNRARHVDGLSWHTLLAHSAQLLRPAGRVALIVPARVAAEVEAAACQVGLILRRRTKVSTRPGKPCRRVLLEWGWHQRAFTGTEDGQDALEIRPHQPQPQPPLDEELCLEDEDGRPSRGYVALTRAFYLKF